MMLRLEYAANQSPRQRGHMHGEMFRNEIKMLADIRVYLAHKVGWLEDRDAVMEIARAHLPVLHKFSPPLYEELLGIAEGSAQTPEAIVVLNHYTDLRDLDGPTQDVEVDGGCSLLYARTPGGPIAAQTWDMHATAMPYVMMLKVCDDERVAWLLSLTGCLGMAGLNDAGVAVLINNLHSTDAQIGAVWPAIVRRALAQDSETHARAVIERAPIGSGHHYFIADERKASGIETSGTRRALVFNGLEPTYVHTNHCVHPQVAERSRVPHRSTTHARYVQLSRSLQAAAISDAMDAWHRLGSQDGFPRSVCTSVATPFSPHGAATCAAIVADISHRTVLACRGFPTHVEPERFEVER